MLDFIAIDFETANSYRGSPCAVGLVRVRNGLPVAERKWLIRPPAEVDHFDGYNTFIHGITPDMVASAPRWRSILPSIIDFIGDDVVVAHNAGFDIGVIRYACAVDNIEWPEMRFLCTMVLARRALALPSYRLPFVLETLGGLIGQHHEPLADALAVVEVVRRLAATKGVDTVEGLAASAGICIGRVASGLYRGSVAISPGSGGAFARPELNPNADPDGYLYGRVVVFTGTLMSMTRRVAWEECARVGATPDDDTTKRTNVLVIGDINPAVLRPGSNVTGKTRRAFELQNKGQPIEVMTEGDFVRCLDGKPLVSADTVLESGSDSQQETPVGDAVPARLRKVLLSERPVPKPPKPPRPLRRDRISTDQRCSVRDCIAVAAFRTRSKPTWCDYHIAEIQGRGGLRSLEAFTHPDDWQLTECINCTVQAHYRFNYTLEKNACGELTCRACFWRGWAVEARALRRQLSHLQPVPVEEAKSLAEEHGFDYLGPLTAPSLPDDPHHTRCRRCGKISAERLADIAFGCTC